VSLLGRFPALAGADLVVDDGEVVLLQGPNGAGKSTLLRLIAGLAPLNDGSGRVLGADLTTGPGRRTVRRQVGLLGHGAALYDDLTVEQNLRFWASASGSDPAMVDPAMDRLGIGGRLRSVPVSGLSAGQRKRTSMAVVICKRPRLWLLDEPHAGLDRAGRDLVDDLVRQAVDQGATAIVASHELDRVAGLATRVARVVGGHVE
jgi:heme ABC exporter ATP-binding subunit CcmA